MLNAGVDITGFKPVTLEELILNTLDEEKYLESEDII